MSGKVHASAKPSVGWATPRSPLSSPVHPRSLPGRRLTAQRNEPISPRPGLTVSEPDDALEREAERITNAIVSETGRLSGAAPAIGSTSAAPDQIIQRECACGGSTSGSQPCPTCAQHDEEAHTVQRNAIGAATNSIRLLRR
jgi:hypothetical protein